MLMTTSQAAEMWCPMVRLVAATAEGAVPSEQPVFNRVQVGTGHGSQGKSAVPSAARCLAEKCAMWRWAAVEVNDPLAPALPALGYCGLAGRPFGALP